LASGRRPEAVLLWMMNPGLSADMPKMRLGAILEPRKFMNEEIIVHVPTLVKTD